MFAAAAIKACCVLVDSIGGKVWQEELGVLIGSALKYFRCEMKAYESETESRDGQDKELRRKSWNGWAKMSLKMKRDVVEKKVGKKKWDFKLVKYKKEVWERSQKQIEWGNKKRSTKKHKIWLIPKW